MSEPTDPPVSPPPVGVLDRGLLLLHLFTLERNKLHLRELSELSRLDKATTLRALKSLVNWGFLERHADGSYSPGPMNLRLAAIFKFTSNLVSRMALPLNRISERVNQSASFFVRSDDTRVCLGRSRTKTSYTYYVDPGTSVPLAHGGSAAKALLAFSGADTDEARRIREDGYALSRGERLRHFASISVPLHEVDGTFLGVVTVSALGADVSDEDLLRCAAVAREELERSGFSAAIPGHAWRPGAGPAQ